MENETTNPTANPFPGYVEDDSTQPATQQVLDPRRLGRNNSGLVDADISDVLCILHPCSPAAFRIVSSTAERSPQHVLQNNSLATFDDWTESHQLEEQETFVIRNEVGDNAQDLALRLSSRTIQPVMGFCFGRNARSCDIAIDVDSVKRVSNLHFRIFVNTSGVLMLEDMSTNGTLVDDKHLKGKGAKVPATRMLVAGSIIQIPSSKPDESIKFIVRIPNRQGHQHEYQRKLEMYIMRLIQAEKEYYKAAQQQYSAQPYQIRGSVPTSNAFGMHWDGGDEFNVVGMLGKGAFATVYKLATKLDGQFFAAKELEKKRFIRNGRLDQRLDNEMRIMESIRHPNVVQYINYQDISDHLYIIMEYVPCGDLQGYISQHGTLPEPDAKLMSRQVLDALHYLHGNKITHRDIKPDNILISRLDPFTIKLSDFGLSKVVNTDQTFLKTFCGTLLYCAPEVFPHYDDHVQKKGIKRRRSGGSQKTNFHSYSQSVDIWSYAAVLWLSLCGKPPFEGVVDQTGKGMFNKIMETRLDISPLLAHGVSKEAIDLLCRMLNTDPALRPTEWECLNHPWLFDGTLRTATDDRALGAISEEDENVEGVNGSTTAFSQLSVNDHRGITGDSMDGEDADFEGGVVKFDSGDLDFLDPRQSKRVKADLLFPRNQIRDQAAITTSSPDFSFQFLEDEDKIDSQATPQQARQPRLFGEIGASALQSSGALGAHTTAALAMATNEPKIVPTSQDYSMEDVPAAESFQGRQVTSDLFRSDEPLIPHPSLLGAESMVRELNMESPNSATSPEAPSDPQSNEPQTPGTPEPSPRHSGSQPQKLSAEITPRSKKPLARQIEPVAGGSRFSNFANSTLLRTQANSALEGVPDTMNGSELSDIEKGTRRGMPPVSAIAAMIPSEATQPLPRLGRLTSTVDSFSPICLRIDDRIAHWGRDPSNSIVYPHKLDTRIAKRALELHFHAYGIEKEMKLGKDWTSMDGIETLVHTLSRVGIWVNGVKLDKCDSDGTDLCGHLYTGDVITIFKDKDLGLGRGPETLKFVCEFYVGAAAGRRPADLPFKPEKAIG